MNLSAKYISLSADRQFLKCFIKQQLSKAASFVSCALVIVLFFFIYAYMHAVGPISLTTCCSGVGVANRRAKRTVIVCGLELSTGRRIAGAFRFPCLEVLLAETVDTIYYTQ